MAFRAVLRRLRTRYIRSTGTTRKGASNVVTTSPLRSRTVNRNGARVSRRPSTKRTAPPGRPASSTNDRLRAIPSAGTTRVAASPGGRVKSSPNPVASTRSRHSSACSAVRFVYAKLSAASAWLSRYVNPAAGE